jgi:TolB-like protein
MPRRPAIGAITATLNHSLGMTPFRFASGVTAEGDPAQGARLSTEISPSRPDPVSIGLTVTGGNGKQIQIPLGMEDTLLNRTRTLLVALLVISFCGGVHASDIKTLLVLPFTLNAQKDLSFLQSGIQDMLSSRLSWKDHVRVLDKTQAQEIHRKLKGTTSPELIRQSALDAGADYVVYGSLTVLGEAVSFDAKVLDSKLGVDVETLSKGLSGMDQLIPAVGDFAEAVNRKVFKKGPAVATVPEPPAASEQPREQEEARSRLSPDYFMSPQDRIDVSTLGPGIVRGGGAGKPVLWRSHVLPMNIKGFDIGDMDGDGKNELVAVTERDVIVFRRTEAGIGEIAKFTIGSFNMLVSVDVADLDHNGVDEAYVINETGSMGQTNSLVLELQDGRLVPIIKNIPWSFRIIQDPDIQEPILIGQRKKFEGFAQGVYKLKRKRNEIIAEKELKLPSRANAFNFNLADLNNDGKTRAVLINDNSYMEVYSLAGDSLWESDYYFGGTLNYVILKYENPFTSEVSDRMYVPARIVVTDLDEDGIPEIIVNRNRSSTFRLTSRYKFFSGSQIVSLSWRGLGLLENWSTTKIPGYVPDYQVKDLDHDGIPDLVVVMVKLDPTGLTQPKSTFIAFQVTPQTEEAETKTGAR